MNSKLIISCPVIGAELTKDIYPHLPTSPQELADEAARAVEAGASIIHLHVRDEQGKPTQRLDVFKDVSERILKKVDCILQYSTGGAVGTPVAERCAPLELKPEMATLSMGTINFGTDVFENKESTIIGISESIQKNGIMPELEVFDYGHMDNVDKYLKKGLIPQKYHVDFVLGVPGGMSGEAKGLMMLVDRLAKGQTWAVAGVGRFQLPLAVHAIAMGGHVRCGIEDNIFYRKGQMAKSNAELIERVVRIAKECDRSPATPNDAREILGLNVKKG